MGARRPLLAILVPLALLAPALVPAAPASAGGTCHEETLSAAKGDAVEMRNNCFTPTVLQAAQGEEITFLSRDTEPHTVTGAGGWGTDFKELFRGQGFRVRFQEPGLYLYACAIHPGMMGAVYVGSDRGIEVANSRSVTPPDDDLTSGEPSSSAEGSEDLQVETASATGESSASFPAVAGLLGVGALAAGYGLGRLRRRTSSGGSS